MDFPMTWYKYPCKLTDETIEEIKGLPWSSYNPFDHYNGKGEKELYLQFAAIDENNPEDIFKFISTYGFLGFNNDKDRNHQEELKKHHEGSTRERNYYEKQIDALNEVITTTRQLAIYALNNPSIVPDAISFFEGNAKDIDNTPLVDDTPEEKAERLRLFRRFISNIPRSESLEDIKQEVVIMRSLVLLWQEIRAKNRDGILTQVEDLRRMADLYRIELVDRRIVAALNAALVGKPSTESINYDEQSDDQILYLASSILSNWINKKLDGVKPVISPMLNFSLQGSWNAPHLLSAMYVMLYMDLTRGVALRKCRNKPCKDFFAVYGNDDRKIYCSESCASAQKQREYRQNKKDKKEKAARMTVV